MIFVERVPLAISDPDLASEAYGWDPTALPPKTNSKVGWRCSLGHTWEANLNNRKRGAGCPYCSGQRILVGFNDLATTYPALAAEALGWDASSVTAGSAFVGTWSCIRAHTWPAAVYSRVAGSGCPICSGRIVLAGFNDLATTNPDLAAEAEGWDPSTVSSQSHQMKAWHCSQWHIFEASIAHRSNGRGCPYCSGNKVLVGFNDLRSTDPNLANEAVGWDATAYSRGSGRQLEWICERNHTYKARIPERIAGNGCPFCSNKKVLVGYNDLATTHPDVAIQASGWDPTTVTAGSNAKRNWTCGLGHIWPASPNTRTSQGTGCPVCANKVVLAGFNDLATTDPELAAEAMGWDPATVTRNSGKRRSWICGIGHTWDATVDHRSNGRGCPSCAKTGFDAAKPGWLYLLSQPEWGLLQVGITNIPAERLEKHRSRGWVDVDLRGPMEGDLARNWESAILKMLRTRGAKVGSTEIVGIFDGYTEAWVTSTHPATSLAELIALVHVDETAEPQAPAACATNDGGH